MIRLLAEPLISAPAILRFRLLLLFGSLNSLYLSITLYFSFHVILFDHFILKFLFIIHLLLLLCYFNRIFFLLSSIPNIFSLYLEIFVFFSLLFFFPLSTNRYVGTLNISYSNCWKLYFLEALWLYCIRKQSNNPSSTHLISSALTHLMLVQLNAK